MSAPVGRWLAASRILGRVVTLDENPHVCGVQIGTWAGSPILTTRADCARCAVDVPWSGARRRHLRAVR